jgi:hypothetical protein
MLDATILSLIFLRKEPSPSLGLLLSGKFDAEVFCSDNKCGAPKIIRTSFKYFNFQSSKLKTSKNLKSLQVFYI